MEERKKNIEKKVDKLAELLKARQMLLAVAESCTGGYLAQSCTASAGSSEWFERGFVTYSNEAKEEMLGVQAGTLAAHGAVSEAVAREMAEGALAHSHAQLAVSITGIAGPSGGTKEKPVGTVCFAVAMVGKESENVSADKTNSCLIAKTEHFNGNREAIRLASVDFVLNELIEVMK